MPQLIQDIMTKQIHTVRKDATIRDVARLVRDKNVSDVLVTNRDGTLCGIVTDRDIVIRAVASMRNLDTMQIGEIVTDDLVVVAPTASIAEVAKLMRDRAVRRIPVVRDGIAVGIVSLGDPKDPDLSEDPGMPGPDAAPTEIASAS